MIYPFGFFRGTFIGGLESFTWLFVSSEIAHFTVTGENEAGVDLVLIQPFLLFYHEIRFFYTNYVFLGSLVNFSPAPHHLNA